MVNQVLVAFNLFSVLFLTSGVLMLIYALNGKRISDADPTEDNVIQGILFRKCPLNGTFIFSLSFSSGNARMGDTLFGVSRKRNGLEIPSCNENGQNQGQSIVNVIC